ncbi:Tetratricopeptide repeat-containing protein [Roseovarius nanhaiticus]|uniref:Tetratricopeptide repeat-containing protein n=1 Tax=Roseovarius nanhaiticus TaxID=573024 RepID=A0A1N7FIE2_9RHOB|nr:tetratricopeptide repeat protein [Roseovarius nanhaiticus]SEK53802.1 Tetratricopeptide repeat-containing protein [Roseovarius nanhaiticus]SIS00122.1 Tetratricopeptide repeat-containing protein [Roseovarius nanhaiticus]
MTLTRATLALIVVFGALAACSKPESDSPFAPGVAQTGASVDAALVGHRLISAGEHELAIKAFSRAALEDGLTSEILLGLGSAYLGLGRVGQAEQLLRDAVAKDESSPEAWNNLGVTLMEQGEIAEAEQMFRRAYALDNGESDSIRDNLRLALAKQENSVYAEAEEQDYKLVRRGSSDYLIRSIP